MFIVGYSSDYVQGYTLSTGFDLSTASYTSSISKFIRTNSPNAQDLAFNTDGTKLFVVDSVNDDVNEYALSTGFDASTASYTRNFDVSGQEATPNGLAFNTDGTKMFVSDATGNTVNEYATAAGTTVPSSDGVSINYDANVLNKGAILGTDYDFDAPAQNKVRITALASNNLKIRVV